MPKNPMFLDKAVLKNGGSLETSAGTSIISVSSSGTPSIKADIKEALAQGSIYIGDASGVTSELDISTDKGILIGNGTTAVVKQISGEATITNAGVVTIGTLASGKTVQKTDDGAVGAELNLYQLSASPALNDQVGLLNCQGDDDGGNKTTYATFIGVIVDPTDGAEIGGAGVNVQNGTGSLVNAVQFGHDGSNRALTTGKVTTDANNGTAGTNVTAAEYGDGFVHTTILTLSGVSYSIAGAANEAVGALIYTFPAGVHVHEVSFMSVALQGGGTVDADTPEVGIGSVIATGAVAVLNGTATFMDYITEQTAGDCGGTPTTAGPLGATAGVLTGISLNKASDAKTVHLNIAANWAGADTVTATGTVVLKWSFID